MAIWSTKIGGKGREGRRRRAARANTARAYRAAQHAHGKKFSTKKTELYKTRSKRLF